MKVYENKKTGDKATIEPGYMGAGFEVALQRSGEDAYKIVYKTSSLSAARRMTRVLLKIRALR